MTEINTSKHARDMSESERQAFLQQCRKLGAAAKQPPSPVETPTLTAKDMSEYEREEWLAEHRRKFR